MSNSHDHALRTAGHSSLCASSHVLHGLHARQGDAGVADQDTADSDRGQGAAGTTWGSLQCQSRWPIDFSTVIKGPLKVS